MGHGFSFHVERSPSGSNWLDKGDWDALQERQFHDELHLIFTEPWQRQVRDDAKREAERAVLTDRLGADLLSKLESIKTSLSDHEHRALAIAYLQR